MASVPKLIKSYTLCAVDLVPPSTSKPLLQFYDVNLQASWGWTHPLLCLVWERDWPTRCKNSTENLRTKDVATVKKTKKLQNLIDDTLLNNVLICLFKPVQKKTTTNVYINIQNDWNKGQHPDFNPLRIPCHQYWRGRKLMLWTKCYHLTPHSRVFPGEPAPCTFNNVLIILLQ